MMTGRYSRQILYAGLGEEGQKKLLRSRVTVVGMGALGCVSSNELARAGIGYLRVIDGDRVDITNLHRQILYTEEDAEKSAPKALAAADRLRRANSGITIDPVFNRLKPENAEELLGGCDLIVDATDNFEARYLINEYCVEHEIPWVYGGAVATEGMTANFLPGGPCFACYTGNTTAGKGSGRTCSTLGVLNSLTAIVASIQVMEAIKILTGSPDVRKTALYFEIWDNEFMPIEMKKLPDCPICGKRQYRYLGKPAIAPRG